MIDASIPLRAAQAAQVNLADIYRQADEAKYREAQIAQQERNAELAEMKMLAELDADKRMRVEAGIADLSSAVQWADTPEKWAQVQAHYGQYDPQLSQVPFQNREMALIKLGKMGDYLKATQEKFQSVEAGGSLIGIRPNGQTRTVLAPNPGDQPMGAPVASGGPQEGATATNPQTGEKIMFRGGQWVPVGGGVGNGTGNFPR